MTIAETLLLDLEPEFHNTRVTLGAHSRARRQARLQTSRQIHGVRAPRRARRHHPRLRHRHPHDPFARHLDLGLSRHEVLLPRKTARRLRCLERKTPRSSHLSTDESLQQLWRLTWAKNSSLKASAPSCYRTQFFNHMIHHRAQLGVYLRLNDLPVPPLYGPTADDNLGF